MAKLTAARRHKLKKSQFGLPDQEAYPEDTRGRAIAAKGRAKTALRRGHITSAQYKEIVGKANRKLGE